GEAALDLADELLKEGQLIYNDYLALKAYVSASELSSCRRVGVWDPILLVSEDDLFWCADPAFMNDVRKARCYIRLCENYATALAARQRFAAAQEAFRTRISKGVIASKNAYNAANAAYTAATSSVPNYVKEQQFYPSSYNSAGTFTAGSGLDTKKAGTELYQKFIANSGSAALANSYRDDLNKRMAAYNEKLRLRSDANEVQYYYENMENKYQPDGQYGGISSYPPSQDVSQSEDMKKLSYLQEDFNCQPYSHRSAVIAYGDLNKYQEDFVKNYDLDRGTGSDYQLNRLWTDSHAYSGSSKPAFKGSAAPSGDSAKPPKTAAPSTLNDSMGIASYAYHAANYYESLNLGVKNPHNSLVQPLYDEIRDIRSLMKAGKADPTWQLRLFKNDGTGAITNFVCAYGIPRRMPTADDLQWSKPGYRLKGWGTTSNATVVAAAAESYVTNTVARKGKKTYYAMWALANEKYALFCEPMGGKLVGGNFGDANGTTKTAQLHVTVGKSDYWALGTATRAGYKFLGWYDEEEGGRKVFDASGKAVKGGTYWDAKGCWKFEGRVRVYAHWGIDPNAYVIRFHKNDGTGLTRDVAFIYGTAKALPTCANGLGWTSAGLFKGWATSRVNAAKGIVWKGDAATVSTAAAKGKTLNVYAVWEKAYNIRFHKQDGTGATYVRRFTTGRKSPLPKCSASLGWARRGFKFKGWATSASAAKVWKAD
ncbi:MAG: InlB B-repeat-containing protein, partial [Kiritimatiellae bacterium]|nr:InlB B-repeat-containing protein [Kiritimatiellia bacterium]